MTKRRLFDIALLTALDLAIKMSVSTLVQSAPYRLKRLKHREPFGFSRDLHD